MKKRILQLISTVLIAAQLPLPVSAARVLPAEPAVRSADSRISEAGNRIPGESSCGKLPSPGSAAEPERAANHGTRNSSPGTVDLSFCNNLKLTGNADHVRTGNRVKFKMSGNAGDLTVGKRSFAEVTGDVSAVHVEDRAILNMKGRAYNITVGSNSDLSLTGKTNRLKAGDESTIFIADDADYVEVGRACTVTLNGNEKEIIAKGRTSLVLNGYAEKVTLEGDSARITGTGRIGTLIYSRKPSVCTVPCDSVDDSAYRLYYKDYDEALDVVQTQVIPCQVKRDTRLYTTRVSDTTLSGYVRDIPEGMTVYNEYHPAGNSFYASFVDESGETVYGWLPRWDCHIPDEEVVSWDGELDYSRGTKEGFVDRMGYSSKTDWLIWISRYTQKVMIFHGKQGDWHLDETFPCSSGANNTPTPAGIYEIITHPHRWNFTGYYVDHVTAFYGDHAFHSVLKNYGGGYYDDTVGIPLSHGCVRMPNEGATYIENESNIPTGTAVIVW